MTLIRRPPPWCAREARINTDRRLSFHHFPPGQEGRGGGDGMAGGGVLDVSGDGGHGCEVAEICRGGVIH